MSRKRVAVLVVLVSLLTVFAILDLEARGVLEPVIVPSLEQSFSYVEGAMRGNEVYVAAAALFVLLVILISRNPPWLPTGYLWVEWGRWQKIGKVRPGYFKFRLLGREFKGIDCGRKKIVFLEGDPEDYEVSVTDKSVTFSRVFGPSLEHRVLGTFFKPKYKVYAARILDDPDEIVNVGWGGKKTFAVDEETGEVFEGAPELEEKLPDSILTKRDVLREIISKMKNIVWVVPRWRATDLKRLAEGEIHYMDVMVEAERAVRNLSDITHSMLEAYRTRVHKSIMTSLMAHLDTCRMAYDEIDSAFAVLAHLYGVDISELKRSLSAAGIKSGEKIEDVVEQWLSQYERRKQLLERYRKVVFPPVPRKQRGKSMAERLKQAVSGLIERPKESKEEEQGV